MCKVVLYVHMLCFLLFKTASLGHQGGEVSTLIGLITSADFNRVLTDLKLVIIDFRISADSQP